MSCDKCTDDCRQGRDCPYVKPLTLDDLKYKCYNIYSKVTTNFTLMEWMVCLATIALFLSLAI
jgi:hypothetical protein